MADETLSYDPELAPGYFVQIRSDFLRSPAFTPTAKVLYLVLCSYAGAGERAWPGQDRLAKECSVSLRTVQRTIDELAGAGLVVVKRRGLTKPNLYHIHKLPVLDASNWRVRDAPNRRVKSRLPDASKPATVAQEVHSVQTHTEEIEGNNGDMPRAYDPFAAAELEAQSRKIRGLG